MPEILRNKYGELRSGWPIASALIIFLLGQVAARVLAPAGKEDDVVSKIVVTLVYCALVNVGGILIFRLLFKRSLRQIGITRKGGTSGFLIGIGTGAVSAIAVFFLLVLSRQAQVLDINLANLFSIGFVIEFLSICVFIFSEGLYFRGFVMTALKTTRNKWCILFSSSFIYGVLHLMTPGITVSSLVNTCLWGFLLAYMFVKSGNLLLSIGYHIGFLFLLGDIFGIGFSGDIHSQQVSIFTTSIKGNIELLTSGIFGPLGGIFITLVLMLMLLYVRFFVKTPDDSIWSEENHAGFCNINVNDHSQMIGKLSKRELEVINAVLAGNYSYKELAANLNISVNTVKTHLKHIYQITGVSNIAALSSLFHGFNRQSPGNHP
jgi:DNA-binding CsgD family transcriptional regulator/membrane protease YdiL (CAAX protease family)